MSFNIVPGKSFFIKYFKIYPNILAKTFINVCWSIFFPGQTNVEVCELNVSQEKTGNFMEFFESSLTNSVMTSEI